MSRIVERGFKSWSEGPATKIRKEMALSAEGPLDPRELAAFLEVDLCTPRDLRHFVNSVVHQTYPSC